MAMLHMTCDPRPFLIIALVFALPHVHCLATLLSEVSTQTIVQGALKSRLVRCFDFCFCNFEFAQHYSVSRKPKLDMAEYLKLRLVSCAALCYIGLLRLFDPGVDI